MTTKTQPKKRTIKPCIVSYLKGRKTPADIASIVKMVSKTYDLKESSVARNVYFMVDASVLKRSLSNTNKVQYSLV